MSAGPPEPEEQARADVYALLARLLYAPPDAALLASLAGLSASAAEEAGSAFTQAAGALARAAAEAEPEAVREEFDEVFVGTGKAEVTLYASAYLTASAHYAPLVDLRGMLGARGLERLPAVSEPEDHLAALFEVMRHLISENDVPAQREFFERFLWPAIGPLCDAIKESSRPRFYRSVAGLMRSFAELEHEAFQMD